MRNKLYIIFTALIAGVLLFGIYGKERILKSDDTFYLKLAPVDPRSLMQGDYMILDYEVNRAADLYDGGGQVVLIKDENGVASFGGAYKGGPLENNQIKVNLIKLNSFNLSNSWARSGYSVAPTSFMFQEGMASKYENAAYGILKNAPSGEVLLVGLADKDLKEIK